MALDDDIRILSQVGLFADLTSEHLRLLAFGAEDMTFAQGREIYRVGASADCAYVIVSGTAELSVPTRDGMKPLRMAGPGSILGELALIAPNERKTTAMAREPVRAIRVNRSLFRRILEEYPEIAMSLHKALSEELTRFTAEVGRLQGRFAD